MPVIVAKSGSLVGASRKTFYGVQVLRGVAAFLVVCFHVTSNVSSSDSSPTDVGGGFHALPRLLVGNAGVDLFFLISGFVIVWTTRDNWSRPNAWRVFLDKRLSRVLPLYWSLTTGKLLAVLAFPYVFRGSHLQVWSVVSSYLLIPSYDGEGRINPLITAGWTLCFEMAFYYVCAICLAVGKRPFVLAAPLLIALGLVGIFRTPGWGAPASLIDPLLLEFVAGMWVGEMARRDLIHGNRFVMFALLMAGIGLWLAGELLLTSPTAYAFRALVWGGPATLILFSTIALEEHLNFRKLFLPLLLGDASYSIYLTHVLVLPPFMSKARLLNLSFAGQWAVYFALVAIGVASGIVVWWIFERNIMQRAIAFSRSFRLSW
jgi:peptidoglycan/LPS O-acetylase OafA/YrhL